MRPPTRRREPAISPRIDITAIRRKQVAEAVRRIIARDGLEAVTIARIAEEADVSRGVVTYHFDRKNEILHDVLREAMTDANRAADSFAVSATPLDLAAFAERVARLSTSDNDWWRIYIAFLAQAPRDEFCRTELAWVNSYYREALRKVLGSDARATIVMALMHGLAIQELLDSGLDLDQVAAEVAALLTEWAAFSPAGTVVDSPVAAVSPVPAAHEEAS